jgi:hypothetical protein
MTSRVGIVSVVSVTSLSLACIPPRTVSDLGPAPSLAPLVSIRTQWRQPPTYTIDLSRSAYVSFYAITINHGVTTVAVATAESLFAAGTHVLRAMANEPRVRAPAIAGGTYPDPSASCAVTDVVKETTQSAVGPDGTIQKTEVITFASPTTSPPITTCSVAGFGEGTSMAGTPLDRYLLVVATSQPINREAVAGALDDLDVTGSPREVSDRVAALVTRVSRVTEWGARAIRY